MDPKKGAAVLLNMPADKAINVLTAMNPKEAAKLMSFLESRALAGMLLGMEEQLLGLRVYLLRVSRGRCNAGRHGGDGFFDHE